MTEPRIYRGWKEIAARLRVGVRTARRWEQEHGLPVRRGPGIYVLEKELERWLKKQMRRQGR